MTSNERRRDPEDTGPWAAELAHLTARQRRQVEHAVASGQLEGWEPTSEEVSALARVASGHDTVQQYIDAVFARREEG